LPAHLPAANKIRETILPEWARINSIFANFWNFILWRECNVSALGVFWGWNFWGIEDWEIPA
jgi:hypothetical protein